MMLKAWLLWSRNYWTVWWLQIDLHLRMPWISAFDLARDIIILLSCFARDEPKTSKIMCRVRVHLKRPPFTNLSNHVQHFTRLSVFFTKRWKPCKAVFVGCWLARAVVLENDMGAILAKPRSVCQKTTKKYSQGKSTLPPICLLILPRLHRRLKSSFLC